MEEMRQLTKDDFAEINRLSEFAFQYTTDKADMEKEKVEADRHTIWGYTVDGKIAGKVHVVPFETFIQGEKFSMGGIGAVSTWPEYRRSGIAKQLMYKSMEGMYEAGQLVSFLHPFHVGFYRKQGWELIATRRHYTIPTESLKRKWQGKGYVRRSDKDIALLNEIYETYAKNYNGMLVRDAYWWNNKVLADDLLEIAVAYNEAGVPEGYIIYKVRDNTFTIQDLAYTTTNAWNVLFEFVSNHDSMATNVKMVAADDDLLNYILDNPRFENKTTPYFMGRIVDVEGFLRQFTFNEVEETVAIEVEDSFFPKNTGTYIITTEKGKATITKTPTKPAGTIKLTIQQLTAICLGYRSVAELHKIGLITGEQDAVESLDEIIPKAQTYFADFF